MGKKKKKFTSAATVVGDEVAVGVMPDLKGLTMRETLRRLERIGVSLQLELLGSGFARTQEPRKGKSLKKGELCRIVFASPLGGVGGS